MALPRGQLEVTMHVYSGRPNPTWTIDENWIDPDLQFERLKLHADSQPQRLGYRGFTVKRKETGIPPPVPTVLEPAALTPAMAVGAVAGAGAGAGLSRPSEDLSIFGVRHIEEKLLATYKDISSTLKRYVSSCLSSPSVTLVSAAPLKKLEWDREELAHAPPFEPALWNNSDHLLENNNCYNYANNIITDTFAQPGKAAGQMYSYKNITGEEVKKASQADGLKAEAERGWNRVALAIWPGQDYHWYRLDNTGYWSHKPGEGQVIDTDNSENKIKDPKTCDMGDYTFVCYMWTHPEKVKIK